MKKKLILYLAASNYPGNISIASTLAWLSKSQGYLFDNYYDNYHQGIHFPGGDSRNLEQGQLTGGTVLGDRHFEEFYFILLNFDVSIVSAGESIFFQNINNLCVPVVTNSGRINVLYREIFNSLEVSLPSTIVMIGSNFKMELSGLEAYLYPEIYHREAIGVPESIPEEELADLCREGSRILCVYVSDDTIARLSKKGYDVEVVDSLGKDDDYLSVTKRITERWKKKVKGCILGDPTLVSHWLPNACEEDLAAVYSIPQERIISELGDLISSKGRVVYGRQYSDRDFFELSKLNQCLQVIDPCRPPFQSVKHVEYNWRTDQQEDGFYTPEYSDEELRQFAHEGTILLSLMFWSGMIREIANFYNLLDLYAMTGLRCGLIMTAQSYEYMMHSPLELLTVPLEQGGVYPLVEPVLGSCGVGVGIESYMSNDRLQDNLKDGLNRILQKVRKANYLPRGWWGTMDTDLMKLKWSEGPKPVRLLRYSPYLQVRFSAKGIKSDNNSSSVDRNILDSLRRNSIDRISRGVRKAGLSKYFDPYRPYEFYRAGPIKEDVVKSVKSAGLQYMFTKAGFNMEPEAQYYDEDFIALNYTAGQWDGWTPFETVNDVSDLREAEKTLLKSNKPGWIVSTIDSCLWTFSGEFWKRGSKLYEIARYCAEGGKSGKLINVRPYTIARYARIMAEEKK